MLSTLTLYFQIVTQNPCWIFDPEIINQSPSIDRMLVPLIECRNFTYDHSIFARTIISDWDLVCSKHYYVHVSNFTGSVLPFDRTRGERIANQPPKVATVALN